MHGQFSDISTPKPYLTDLKNLIQQLVPLKNLSFYPISPRQRLPPGSGVFRYFPRCFSVHKTKRRGPRLNMENRRKMEKK